MKVYVKVGKKILSLVILKLKNKFCQDKSPISINNKDISKIVVSKKVSFSKKGFKYFVGYKDGKK